MDSMKKPKKLFLKKIKIAELDDESSKTVVGGTIDCTAGGGTLGNCTAGGGCSGPTLTCVTFTCPTGGCETSVVTCNNTAVYCPVTDNCPTSSYCGGGGTIGTCSNCTVTGSNCATSGCGGSSGSTWGSSCY